MKWLKKIGILVVIVAVVVVAAVDIMSYVDRKQDEEVMAFITDMYNEEKYNDYDFLEAHCSEQMLKQLAEEYIYDGEGYATWSFRTGHQDWKSDTENTSCILRVEPVGGHWYTYYYLDMGWRGQQQLLVKKVDGAFIIFDKKTIYNER